jgi:sterol desaturase/sphingolipid hydroxylase (fatty acid hydroxylase superfamily)
VATFFVTIGAWFHLEMSVSPRWLAIRHYLEKHRIGTDGSDLAAWDNDNRVSNEVMWYIVPLLLFDVAFPRRYHLLNDHPSAPTLAGLMGGVALSLLLFDLFFFCGHWCMHQLQASAFAARLHGRHHSANNIRAGDAIRHSFLDGSFDVACSVLALKVAQAHPLTRSVYNLVAIYLITEAHCGFDCPWMLHRVVPMQVVAGPRRHDLHHRQGNVNFQKFFTYFDFACGTLAL